ncbi:MAG: transglycosylase domain-containing protein [Ornithinimicrobium sp.]
MRIVTTLARVTSLLGAFVAISVLMGLLGAGLLLPVVGTAGSAAREGVGLFEELPGDLESNPLAQQSRIEAANGSLIATPALQNRIIVGLDAIAPVMQQAQIAIEDERYYDHGGVDPKALGRALVTNATTDDVQGGSTLTQQYVKLTLAEQAEREGDAEAQQALLARSGTEGYVRKLRELKYAVTLEERLNKKEILEGYLNLAYYGDRAYGVEAAARHYFGVKAKDLNLQQAATLAGVVRAPSVTDPVNNPKSSIARRNVVLDKMYAQDMISTKEWEKARKAKLNLDITDSQRTCLNSKYPYFCDYVTNWLLQNDTLGATQQERATALNTGGLTIETTLDPELYKEIHKVTSDSVPPGNKYGLASAAAMVEPGTGKVLAIGQSSTYSNEGSSDLISKTETNWSVDDRYGGSTGFQIGSIAKAFSLVTALEEGVPVDTTLTVRKPGRVDSKNTWINNPSNPKRPVGNVHPAGIFFRKDFDPKCTIGEPVWKVRNAEDANFTPTITLRKATAQSVNTAFATLASQVGTCNIRDTMKRMGLHSGDGDPYGEDADDRPPAFVLGADDSSPLTVASAYATIASGGTYCPPVPVAKITNAKGEDIPLDVPKCEQVVEPEVAAGVAELMKGVVDLQGSGFRAVLDSGQPAGGKTGTADGSVHTWFAGYTPQLSTAVWIGDPTGQKRYSGRLADITLGGRFIEGQLYGSKLGAPMWKEMMTAALEGQPVKKFDKPSAKILKGAKVTVPTVRGTDVEKAIETLGDEGLTATRQPTGSPQPPGTVLYTVPGAGSKVDTGSSVKVFISNGPGNSAGQAGTNQGSGDGNGQGGFFEDLNNNG